MEGWSNHALTRPEFRFFLYDRFGNVYDRIPKEWDLKVWLISASTQLNVNLIFCKSGVNFYICDDKSLYENPVMDNPI